jgi:hypothetical protein
VYEVMCWGWGGGGTEGEGGGGRIKGKVEGTVCNLGQLQLTNKFKEV